MSFPLDKAGGKKIYRKEASKSLSILSVSLYFPPHSAAPQGEPFAFSLGHAVQYSRVVNGIKINDNLGPLGLELPALYACHTEQSSGSDHLW